MRSGLLLFIFLTDIKHLTAQVCFEPKTSYPAGINTSSLCTADFNGDGNMDVAAANKTGTVSILLGSGAGALGTATDFEVGYLPNSVCTSDFNDDSIPDLATANMGPWNASILFGDGTGGFTSGSPISANTPYTIVSADFNGDGFADLAIGTQFTVWISLGNGGGNFGNPVSYGTVLQLPALMLLTLFQIQ